MLDFYSISILWRLSIRIEVVVQMKSMIFPRSKLSDQARVCRLTHSSSMGQSQSVESALFGPEVQTGHINGQVPMPCRILIGVIESFLVTTKRVQELSYAACFREEPSTYILCYINTYMVVFVVLSTYAGASLARVSRVQ